MVGSDSMGSDRTGKMQYDTVHANANTHTHIINISTGLFILWYFWTFKGISMVFNGISIVFNVIFRAVLKIPLNNLAIPLECP